MKLFVKHIALLLCVLLFSILGFSQQTEGKISYTIRSNWTKKMASLDYISKQRIEKQSYVWGNRSEYDFHTILYFTPTQSKYEKVEKVDDISDFSWKGKKSNFFIFHDYEQNRLTQIINFLTKDYVMSGELAAPKWKVLNDLKEIAGHICMNAEWTDTIKGQHIVAWFALDWPLGYGPGRFFGLPGMILEVDINNGASVITAQNIEFTTVDEEIHLPKKLKGKEIEPEKYQQKLMTHIKESKKQERPWFWGVSYEE